MKKRRTKDKDLFTEEYIKKHRKFPVANTVILVLLIIAQIGCICAMVLYRPQPQDRIRQYTVTVTPLLDGSLDITYEIEWEALDPEEPLTWVSVGIANADFTLYRDSLSETVSWADTVRKEQEAYVDLYFKRTYRAGDVVVFSFTINQRSMLCRDGSGYFYEFVPGWFNAADVEHYTFRWQNWRTLSVLNANADKAAGEYLIWEGSMPRGSYVPMQVRYSANAFVDSKTVRYEAFTGEGVEDAIRGQRVAVIVLLATIVIAMLIAELYIVDSYVSYQRGRGFLVGHDYYIHTYGHVNPHYRSARQAYNAAHGRGGRGGGCACACACACAGGGRAGCSQKDTYQNTD